jgi:hypothetical protein
MERIYRRQARACCRAEVRSDRAVSSGVYQALLLLGAITLWMLLFVAFAGVGGCSRQGKVVCSQPGSRTQAVSCRNTRFVPVLVQASEGPRPSLIFPADPSLTPVPAESFSRADWPTTPGRYDAGQTVNYQEYWYDSQTLSPYNINYGYRTFTSQRNGMQTGP